MRVVSYQKKIDKIIESDLSQEEKDVAVDLILSAFEPIHFIKNHCKIESSAKGIVNFDLYPYQEETIQTIEDNRFSFFLKSRQMGFTTMAAAYSLWYSLKPGNNILLLSRREDDSMDILRKVKIMYENLPERLKVPIVSSNQTTMEFSNKNRITSLPATERSGAGRCHAKGTKIVMFNGLLKNVEDLRVGDVLMGIDSRPRKVLKTRVGREKMYKIIPNRGGEPFIVNKNHKLSLKFKRSGHSRNNEVVNMSVKDYLEGDFTQKRSYKLWRASVEFEEKPLEIEPYFLGLWLGDGNSRDQRICTPEKEVVSYLRDYNKRRGGVFNEYKKKGENASMYTVGGKNSIVTFLKKINLYKNKHIPHIYKCNSKKNRLELLAGLIDSDGYVDKTGYVFCNTNKTLIEDTLFLARSLGFQCTMSEGFSKKFRTSIKTNKKFYKVFINGDCDKIPTKIKRKQVEKRKINKDWSITGFTVEEMPEDNFYGFTLDGDHLYMIDSFIVNHNSASVIFLDEFSAFPAAKWAVAGEDVWIAILPTISTNPNSKVVVMSTPKGMGNHFANLWHQENGFVKKFFHWTKHPEFSKGLVARKNPGDGYGKWTSDWAEPLMRNMTPSGWAQEFNGDFVQSGRPVFDWNSLVKNDLTDDDLKFDFHYVCGVDLASGSGEDWHVAQFLCVETGKQVHSLRAKDTLEVFGKKVVNLCKRYNNAKLGFENNSGYGQAFISHIGDYENLYYQTKLDRRTQRRTRNLGWNTNTKSKELMISDMAIALINKQLLLTDDITIGECKTYQYEETQGANGHERMNAMAGHHDDSVIAMAIAWQIAKSIGDVGEYASPAKKGLATIHDTVRPDGTIKVGLHLFDTKPKRDWRYG